MRHDLSRIRNVVLVAGLLSLPGIALAQKPNIIVMLSDDQGWTGLSVGSTNYHNQSDFFETPNLERVAAQGLSFTNAYANAARCMPSRAALISGQYAPRTGVYRNPEELRPPDAPLIGAPNTKYIGEQAITLAETLKTAGYVTAHFGKFHVASKPAEITQWHGFDFNFGGGHWGRPESYFAEQSGSEWHFVKSVGSELDAYAKPYDGAYLKRRGLPLSLAGTPKHLTDAMGDAAVEFLEAAADPQRLGGDPFYMQIHFYAPHRPIEARPDLVEKYQRKALTNPSSVGHDKTPAYAALIESMDEQVGRILKFLHVTDDPRNPGQPLSENTLVVFFSDNGPQGFSSTPLTGGKADYTEGGIRVPMLVMMPGRVPASVVSECPVIGVDFYPTFADLAGATLPNANTHPLDGQSLVSLLMGDPRAEAALRGRPIFWHFPEYDKKRGPKSIIRRGDWKLIYNYEDQSYELYDLALDLGESNDLLDTQGGCNRIAAELSLELRNWLDSVDADYPRRASSGTEVPPPAAIDCGDGGSGDGAIQNPVPPGAAAPTDGGGNTTDGSIQDPIPPDTGAPIEEGGDTTDGSIQDPVPPDTVAPIDGGGGAADETIQDPFPPDTAAPIDGGGGGGGCVLTANADQDPSFLLMLLASTGYLFRRRILSTLRTAHYHRPHQGTP
jgi:arylsulfatase A-like enzyme